MRATPAATFDPALLALGVISLLQTCCWARSLIPGWENIEFEPEGSESTIHNWALIATAGGSHDFSTNAPELDDWEEEEMGGVCVCAVKHDSRRREVEAPPGRSDPLTQARTSETMAGVLGGAEIPAGLFQHQPAVMNYPAG